MLFGLIPIVYAQLGSLLAISPCGAGSGTVDLGDCLKLSDSTRVSTVYHSPAVLADLLTGNLFVVAGVIFFLFLIVAGFKFITGGQKGAEDAKNILTTALVGFVVMFAAYWIIQIVVLLTGVTIPGVTVSGGN